LISKNSSSDSTYHARHSARSLRRARRIAANIDAASSLLDVGCNNGITSEFLLEKGKVDKVTGVELHASTVSGSLMQNPRFSLIEGDIAKLDIIDNFDVCIYGAVHHHILNFNGLGIAVQTLQKLAAHCNQTLFFETGQITEGGRWDWQRAIRRYFRTDEEHLYYLLSSIEHMVESYSVIGKFWIHGIRRTFLRIDLKPMSERSVPAVPAKIVPAPTDADTRLVRSCGSRDQRLMPADELTDNDSPCSFWIAGPSTRSKLFMKQHRHRPSAAVVEWQIGRGVANDWAVCPDATTELPGSLVFPYLDGARKIRSFYRATKSERRNIAEQLLAIFSDSRNIRPQVPHRLLLPTQDNSTVHDLCDLNSNNFMVLGRGDELVVRVVDFEQQSCQYSYRNRLHLASMLSALGQFRMRALREYALGLVGGLCRLIEFQAKPIETRIRFRQPSALSVLVAEVRSPMGAVTRFILDAIGYG
jgi:SAM-dependent methyltransferase